MRESIKMKTKDYAFKYRVAAIIIKNNKILVDKTEDSPNYYLPGGYVELGETAFNALIRELKEELLVDFTKGKYFGILENFFNHNRRGFTHEISIYYLMDVPDSLNDSDFSLTENDKGFIVKHDFKWISLDEFDKYDFRPVIIKDYIKNKKEFNHLVLDTR